MTGRILPVPPASWLHVGATFLPQLCSGPGELSEPTHMTLLGISLEALTQCREPVMTRLLQNHLALGRLTNWGTSSLSERGHTPVHTLTVNPAPVKAAPASVVALLHPLFLQYSQQREDPKTPPGPTDIRDPLNPTLLSPSPSAPPLSCQPQQQEGPLTHRQPGTCS